MWRRRTDGHHRYRPAGVRGDHASGWRAGGRAAEPPRRGGPGPDRGAARLGRMAEAMRSWRGDVFLKAVAEDEIAGPFLALYDLGEGADERDLAEAEESVNAALEELRPFVESHGGMITVEKIQDGIVTVQM